MLAQAVAFGSRSSLAALPALVEGAGRLRVPSEVGGFVLPLAVSPFKVSAPITWMSGAFFIARVNGVEIGAAGSLLIGVASVILNSSVAGIPSGSLLVMAPVFSNLGLPVEGIGILMALDLVPDFFKTVANVTGDMVAAVILARVSRVLEVRVNRGT